MSQAEIEVIIHRELIPQCVASSLDDLKKRASEMLLERRGEEEGFRSRHIDRWREGFDLLETLLVIAEETGDAINNADGPKAGQEEDLKFEAVVTLHARAILVSREILCLLKGGYADGALGRWRTLHEVAVVAQFLSAHDRSVSERYLLHREVQAHKAMLQYLEYQERANLDPFDEKHTLRITEVRDKILEVHGHSMLYDWGWAAPAIGKDKPTFFDLEKSLDLDHWRPRYKWASQDTHGTYRHPAVLLGMCESEESLLLVGPSGSGLSDPAQMTAISLVLATDALTQLSPTIDRLVIMRVLLTLSDEVGEVFFATDCQASKDFEQG